MEIFWRALENNELGSSPKFGKSASMNIRSLIVFLMMAMGCGPVAAWDYTGHRMVNALALAALPETFPAFVHEPANAERILFLSGEPDRWRNSTDLPLKQYNGLDHYFDLEQLADAGMDVATVSDLRYVFVAEFAEGRAAHPENFPAIDPQKNTDHTREWPGLLPWAVSEYYSKLKSAFSYLKTFEKAGTADEIANAKANVLYVMGVMGHYVGDGAQPLHTSVHHNGWAGKNPQGFTKWPGIHSWIDGGFIAKAGITAEQLRSRVSAAQEIGSEPRPDGRAPVFVATVDYLRAQNARVVPFYTAEKAGVFKSENVDQSVEGREFIETQLLRGGTMLGSIWLTAWLTAAPDSYLEKQLEKRRKASEN